MGKKHKKHGGKHDAHRHDGGAGQHGPFPAPLMGIAAMVTQQLQSPAVRATLATGLRAAADALSKPAASRPGTVPQPPAPPHAPVPPQPAAAPDAATASPGAARPSDPGAVIGEAAELVLSRLFGKKG